MTRGSTWLYYAGQGQGMRGKSAESNARHCMTQEKQNTLLRTNIAYTAA